MLLLAAAARPTALMVMPTEGRTVILAMDVSGSMRADDVAPTRLEAAKAAARDFVKSVPASVRIGVVAFSDDAHLVQAPVADRDDILAAIASLRPQNGTAIGSGIVTALNAIFPDARFNLDQTIGVPRPRAVRADSAAAIILLTDGQNIAGPDPVDAAHLAATHGVRLYTVGIGTPFGQVREGGLMASVGIDEDALKGLAAATGAEYFYATSAPDLRAVYARLGASVVLARIRTEVTALVCGLAALLATASAGLSLFWFGRVL